MKKLNINASLAKLSTDKRISLIIEHRACHTLNQNSPLSEKEYSSIYASLKSRQEIDQYNKANYNLMALTLMFSDIERSYSEIAHRQTALSLIWVYNLEIDSILDVVNEFLYYYQNNADIDGKRLTKHLTNAAKQGTLLNELETASEGGINLLELCTQPKAINTYHSRLKTALSSYMDSFNEAVQRYGEYSQECGLKVNIYDRHIAKLRKEIEVETAKELEIQ